MNSPYPIKQKQKSKFAPSPKPAKIQLTEISGKQSQIKDRREKHEEDKKSKET